MEKETIILCPCKKKSCPRYGDCEACRAHHEKNGRYAPYCEKKAKKQERPGGREA